MPGKSSPASSQLPIVTITPRGAARLKAGHPWVYRSDVISSDWIPAGAMVQVKDSRGRLLGTAFYSSSSQIAIRLISDKIVSDLPGLLRERIRAAVAYRKQVVSGSDAYRVVFSEADFLPGVIVDRYHDIVSMQILTQAMDAPAARAALLSAVDDELHPESVVERVEPRVRELEKLPPRESGLLQGSKTSTIFTMNGVQFHYSALEGQKTGAFLDQRENYAAAAQYAHGDALDVFCYQGGFALHLAEKCSHVTGVDSSRAALEVADQNAALNRRDIEWMEANAFDLLKDYAAAGRRYDTIVLDPPAFAKSRRDLDSALRGYKELNLRALKMLRPGGVLVTCSCSYHVAEEKLLAVVAEAARDAHQNLRLLEKRGPAKDHPMAVQIPESAYLKVLIFYVSY
jgi:23S rRNA (cytosine1962-C5)-methyltransferase